MPTLPSLDLNNNVNHAPHVVILGAGASRACCPNGDRNGKKLPLMLDFVDTLGLEKFLNQNGVLYEGKNFEDVYDELKQNQEKAKVCSQIEQEIWNYFSSLQLPDSVTVYDQLVLSLRQKDLIATFNWDPLLLQAVRRNSKKDMAPQLAFLHGNVAVGLCESDSIAGFIENECSKCSQPLVPSRLLFPISNKDYSSDRFIADEWKRLRFMLEEAYLLTIFGYSAPQTDAGAIEIIQSIWAHNRQRELAEIEIINRHTRSEIADLWKSFITRDHFTALHVFSQSYQYSHPRRSCDAFAGATLQLAPWPDNPMPNVTNLNTLQQFVEPLVEEERHPEEPFKHKATPYKEPKGD